MFARFLYLYNGALQHYTHQASIIKRLCSQEGLLWVDSACLP